MEPLGLNPVKKVGSLEQLVLGDAQDKVLACIRSMVNPAELPRPAAHTLFSPRLG